MYAGIWCIYEEIWFKMMIMGEWNDAKMDSFINKIMKNWRPNMVVINPTFSNHNYLFVVTTTKNKINITKIRTNFHEP